MNKERISAYLASLEPMDDPELNRLRACAEADGVPIVRIETEAFLRTMVKVLRPQRVLEIGTAVGYSSIVMARAGAAWIDTIENYEKRIPIARGNIKDCGLDGRIRLLEGDAGDILKELKQSGTETYDLVFLDAAKGQYLNWLPDIVRLMHPGSVLITDNVLQDETVMESRFLIPRRERTTHARMRDYLYELKHDARLETSVIPAGDGISLSVLLDPEDQ